jgi:UDPglucose 6-dehydrogenase
MLTLYGYFVEKKTPFVITNWESAELIKYASNTFLAMKISFINELARLAEKTGADIKDITRGMGLDSRIGPKFLNAGIGWGGSCFPKDVEALIWQFREYELEPKLPKATKEINEEQLIWFFNKIKKAYGGRLAGKTFALLGLAFKPGTDDLRESPALKLAELLIEEGAFVKGFDYVKGARENVRKLVEVKASTRYGYGLTVYDDLYEAVKGANGVIIAVEYKEWNKEDWNKVSKLVKERKLFDGRNVLDKNLIRFLKKLKWHYEGIGILV